MTSRPAYNIYDALLDNHLQEMLDRYPELRTVFGKLDAEEHPARYAGFQLSAIDDKDITRRSNTVL